MTATGYWRGWPVRYDDLVGAWVYADTGVPCHEDPDRPCARCGRPPTDEGHDACLGHIPGAVSACCGHGRKSAYIQYADGRRVEGDEEVARAVQGGTP